MKRMRHCKACSLYTLKERCPRCKETTVSPLPPRFSPEDPYGEYRRRLKRVVAQEREVG